MQRIDEARLETDLEYRFNYLTEFIGFTADDVQAIHGAAGLLGPLVPGSRKKTARSKSRLWSAVSSSSIGLFWGATRSAGDGGCLDLPSQAQCKHPARS